MHLANTFARTGDNSLFIKHLYARDKYTPQPNLLRLQPKHRIVTAREDHAAFTASVSSTRYRQHRFYLSRLLWDYQAFIVASAQGEIVHNDDTTIPRHGRHDRPSASRPACVHDRITQSQYTRLLHIV